MRLLFNFLIPGSILITATLFFLNSPYLHQITRFQVNFGSIILLVLCALLSWRFDRSRILYTLQILFYSDLGIYYLDIAPSTSNSFILIAFSLINLAFVAMLKERGIHSFRGLLVTCLPVIQAAAILYWMQNKSPIIAQLKTTYLKLPASLSSVPELILILIVITLLIQLIRFLRYPTPLEGAMFWTIVGVASTLFFSTSLHTTTLHAAAVLGLLIAFIEMSYALAYRDELTGVPGRRALMEAFAKLGNRYSIAMVDIDFFKKFNDKYGHDIVDQVLKMVASRLAKCSNGGRVFRYGGEEFCIVFSGKNSEECLEALEELRGSIGDHPFTIRKIARPVKKPKKTVKNKRKQNSVRVTISIGVAEKTALYNQPDVVMKRADQALYRAKEAGRNRVSS